MFSVQELVHVVFVAYLVEPPREAGVVRLEIRRFARFQETPRERSKFGRSRFRGEDFSRDSRLDNFLGAPAQAIDVVVALPKRYLTKPYECLPFPYMLKRFDASFDNEGGLTFTRSKIGRHFAYPVVSAAT